MGQSWWSPATPSWRTEGAAVWSPRRTATVGSGGRGQVGAGSHGIRCERPPPYRAYRSDRPAQAPGVLSLWRPSFHAVRGAPICGTSRGIFNNRSPGGRSHAADGSAGRIPQVTPHQLPGVGALLIDVHRDCILRASVRRHRNHLELTSRHGMTRSESVPSFTFITLDPWRADRVSRSTAEAPIRAVGAAQIIVRPVPRGLRPASGHPGLVPALAPGSQRPADSSCQAPRSRRTVASRPR
jgi:hypothetical protein